MAAAVEAAKTVCGTGAGPLGGSRGNHLTMTAWGGQKFIRSLRGLVQERQRLADYVCQIERFNASQQNSALLNDIRQYNHHCVDSLARSIPLRRKRLLEIGASPHGYSLERALAHGVREYVGVGLDIDQAVEVRGARSRGRLLRMDATQLEFKTASFDAVLSISTFEHISDVPAVLGEIRRVLRSGGVGLVTFEPVWTCSYGHHLHHFGTISKLMPDWAHLLWTKEQMLDALKDVWPEGVSPSLPEAAAWVHDSPALNRVDVRRMRQFFRDCGMTIRWMVSMEDQARDPARLRLVSEAVQMSPEDLMTKGLSVFLAK
ncbi:MAG: class I SAM-dependent methyltransferase [Bryobacteraceae bacterium]